MKLKPLRIITCENSGRVWDHWVAALSEEGFKCEVVDRSRIAGSLGLDDFEGVILVDGLLPRLSTLIVRMAFCCPAAKLIVATRNNSFSVYLEAQQSGAIYISDLESPARFIESFRKAVFSEGLFPDGLLPRWI